MPVLFAALCFVVQGWIDTTYMNQEGTFRLARGNKGTLFVREYLYLVVIISLPNSVGEHNCRLCASLAACFGRLPVSTYFHRPCHNYAQIHPCLPQHVTVFGNQVCLHTT